MERENLGSLVVERDGRLCGIITDRDIALRVVGTLKDPAVTPVREVMTPDPIRISVNKTLRHLTSLMHAYHGRRVPIVDDFDTTVGIVSLDDLIARSGDPMSEIGKALAEKFPREID